ncbi:MAG: UDP-3-O-(3-hydroxymyristoyl)glucosamine N-acyltransferase [Bacteroidota bacterium]|nr:UDP-3-O-(3-hydroxymyristoyl)glucosamine N-acyltransferase [Bacteroidota bacterium]
MTVKELARFVNGEITGSDEIEISHLAKIEEAQPGDITFLSNPKYVKYLSSTKAAAILISKDTDYKELATRQNPIVLIKVENPYLSFLKLIDVFYPEPQPLPKGLNPSAVISPTASIDDCAAIGANVVVGARAIVRSNSAIWHNTVIGDDVEIGNNVLIYPNVSIRERCKIGNRVIIHSGTVVGSDGFGFAPKPDGTYEKIPQRGNVVIEDDVEIGSNCSIDRATLGETRIKRGSKLDNLVQVAHNVTIGENTVIAAQTGIAGSTTVGNNCLFGGQVGVVGHIKIADKSIIAAQSGISKSLTEGGKTYFGTPAMEIGEMRKIIVSQRQLPELLKEFENLKKEIAELKSQRLLIEKENK